MCLPERDRSDKTDENRKNGVETPSLEVSPHHFFDAMQFYKITLFSVLPSTPESESLFRLS